jgi:hypothetical protein
MSADSKKMRATTRPRGRAAALATQLPTRKSRPLARPLAKPALQPPPTKPRFSKPPEAMRESILDSAPQAAASRAIQPAAGSPTESTRASAEKIFGVARERVETASQMAATSAAERRTPSTQDFAAYIHASTAAVSGMHQLGQLWVAFLQVSIRQSAAAAFGWMMRR